MYNVPEATLRRRRAGTASRRDTMPNSTKLLPIEESSIVDFVLELDSRGFAPPVNAVREMANKLLAARGLGEVGKNWPTNFVNRHDAITMKFNRKIDYKRYKQEELEIIAGWFQLVVNVKAKYGILDEDTYNFDESGFQMGIIYQQKVVTGSERRHRPRAIQPGNREWVTVIEAVGALGFVVPPFIIYKGRNHLSGWFDEADIPPDWVFGVSNNGWTTNALGFEWLKHFDRHTKARTVGGYRLLILDGHESHDSMEFTAYCKANNIITLCMPAHSSHLLQPLDVGVFSPLKKAYGRQVEKLMRNQINHITKLEFLPCFRAAFSEAITESNVQGGFRGAGLVPFDPDRVLSMLDVRIRTPTPPTAAGAAWESKTPTTHREFTSQSKFVKDKLGSLLGLLRDGFAQLIKGAAKMNHQLLFLQDRIAELEEANAAANGRKSRKRKRVQQGGTITFEAG